MTDQLTLTVDPLAYVIAWTRKNPAAWQKVIEWAHRDRARRVDPDDPARVNAFARPHGLIGRFGGLEVRLTDQAHAEGHTKDHGKQHEHDQPRTGEVGMAPEQAPRP